MRYSTRDQECYTYLWPLSLGVIPYDLFITICYTKKRNGDINDAAGYSEILTNKCL